MDDPDLSPPAACDLVVISVPFLPPVVSGFLFLPHVVSSSPGGGGCNSDGRIFLESCCGTLGHTLLSTCTAGAGKHSITEEGVGLGTAQLPSVSIRAALGIC